MVKRLKQEHSKEVENEGTRRVHISIMNGRPNVREDATNNLWHDGSHSSIESF